MKMKKAKYPSGNEGNRSDLECSIPIEPAIENKKPFFRTKKVFGNLLFSLIFVAVIVMTFFCTSCASDSINSPCPNYGEWCSKTPINSWTGG